MKKFLFLIISLFILESCSSIERVATETFSDSSIKGRIEYLWFGTKKDSFNGLTVRVQDGRVLIAGKINNPEEHVQAIRLAWQAEGVKEIVDQITIGQSNWKTYAQDTWITLQIKNHLLWDLGIASSHYNISTVDGIVYILGVGENQAELDRAITQARYVQGVKHVTSYVRLK